MPRKLLFLLLLSALGFLSCRRQAANPLLGPAWAAQEVAGAKSLYFSQPLEASQRDERASMFAQAALDPKYWRQLDRRFRFDVALLSGDPAFYRPLLDHLRRSPDWTLTHVDHASILFRRPPAEAWNPESLKALAERFTVPAEKTEFYVQAAGRLLALDKADMARDFLQKALAINPKAPQTWTQLANLEVRQRQWEPAMQDVEKALAAKPDYLPAVAVKTQILLATRRQGEAFHLSTWLIQQGPENPEMLLLHARASHSVGAYGNEIEALRKIVALAEKNRQSGASYRIYLGQALSADGQSQAALEEFEKALESADLADSERDFAKQAVERLRPSVAP